MFTALLITLLVLIGAATAVGGGLALARRRQNALAGADEAKQLTAGGQLIERGLRELRPGDVVTYETRDFIVEGVVAYDEDGHRWAGAKLSDGSDARWLVVGIERGGAQSVRMLAEDRSIEMAGYPPETVLAGDTRFGLDKRGTATARLSGDVGGLGTRNAADAVERCRWWLYSSTDDDTLIVEQWGSDYRTLRGKRVPDGMIDMMPGS